MSWKSLGGKNYLALLFASFAPAQKKRLRVLLLDEAKELEPASQSLPLILSDSPSETHTPPFCHQEESLLGTGWEIHFRRSKKSILPLQLQAVPSNPGLLERKQLYKA